METITAREFLENTFDIDFLYPDELETMITAMELYAKGKCKEQRTLCAQEIQKINPSLFNHPLDISDAMISTPEPVFELEIKTV